MSNTRRLTWTVAGPEIEIPSPDRRLILRRGIAASSGILLDRAGFVGIAVQAQFARLVHLAPQPQAHRVFQPVHPVHPQRFLTTGNAAIAVLKLFAGVLHEHGDAVHRAQRGQGRLPPALLVLFLFLRVRFPFRRLVRAHGEALSCVVNRDLFRARPNALPTTFPALPARFPRRISRGTTPRSSLPATGAGRRPAGPRPRASRTTPPSR